MLTQLAQALVDWIGQLGYGGIFALMFVESSFVPFPSEIVMVPAGYLAYKGELSLWLSFVMGVLGSLAGALLNYYLAKYMGRRLLERYGKYLFIKPDALVRLDSFFAKHGEISTLIGRLIPGIRQLISIPAGLASMSIGRFSLYTLVGAGAWNAVLLGIGYVAGSNSELIHHYLKEATVVALVVAVVGVVLYLVAKRR